MSMGDGWKTRYNLMFGGRGFLCSNSIDFVKKNDLLGEEVNLKLNVGIGGGGKKLTSLVILN